MLLLLAISCHWVSDAEHRAFIDADMDGYASDRFSDGTDCDDSDPAVHPGAVELCDGIDNNCDGEPEVGDDCVEPTGDFDTVDDDGDGFSEEDGDCDDDDASVNPEAEEVWYDGVDQDCSGGSDYDADGDGEDAESGGGLDCDDTDAEMNTADVDGDGYSPCEGDCHDGDRNLSPTNQDTVGDGIDQNCDGVDGFDGDGDGSASGWSGGDDCDDEDSELSALDADGDGVSTCDADCDDSDAGTYPGAPDSVGDGLDQNCDNLDGDDADGDGFASTESGGRDCNDSSASSNPSGTEKICDGLDSDCNGKVDDGAACDVSVRNLEDPRADSNGHAYLFIGWDDRGVLPGVGWHNARTYCQSWGYDLAIVNDEFEWDWLENVSLSFIGTMGATYDWHVGYSCVRGDCDSTSDWEWIDGSAGYYVWSSGHPEINTELGMGYECAYAHSEVGGPTDWHFHISNCQDNIQVLCESP